MLVDNTNKVVKANLPLISHKIQFRFTLSFSPLISSATLSLLVLSSKAKGREDATTEQEKYQVSQDNTVAEMIFGRVLLAIDIAADDAVQVSPSLENIG